MNLELSVRVIANASLLDRISVEYYGVETRSTKLLQLLSWSSCSFGDTFDKSSLKDIERAINASDLGITPASDGSVIRLVIPALTEKLVVTWLRSEEKLARTLRLRFEISVVMLWMKKLEARKAKEIEDELKTLEKDIQK